MIKKAKNTLLLIVLGIQLSGCDLLFSMPNTSTDDSNLSSETEENNPVDDSKTPNTPSGQDDSESQENPSIGGGDTPTDVDPSEEPDDPGTGGGDTPTDVDPSEEPDDPGTGGGDTPTDVDPSEEPDDPGTGGGDTPQEEDDGKCLVEFFTNFGLNSRIFSCRVDKNTTLSEKILLGKDKYYTGYFEPQKGVSYSLYDFVGWSKNPMAQPGSNEVYSLDRIPAISENTCLYAIHTSVSTSNTFIKITSPFECYLGGLSNKNIDISVVTNGRGEYPDISDYSLTKLNFKIHTALNIDENIKIQYKLFFDYFFDDYTQRFTNVYSNVLSNLVGCKYINFGSIKQLGDYTCGNGSFEIIEGENISSIGERCFKNCADLFSFNLPLITSYPKESVYGTGIVNLSISSSIKNIGERAFAGCKKIGYISYEGTKEDFLQICNYSIDRFEGVNLNTMVSFSNAEETLADVFN